MRIRCLLSCAIALLMLAGDAGAGVDTWNWHRYRAVSAYYAGDYAQVGEHLELALASARSVPGADPEVATSLNDLGVWAQRRGDFVTAERLLREALAIRERVFPSVDVDVANSLNSLADFFIELGRYAEAQPLVNRARRVAIAAAGTNHTETLVANVQAARLAIHAGNLKAAEFSLLSAMPSEGGGYRDGRAARTSTTADTADRPHRQRSAVQRPDSACSRSIVGVRCGRWLTDRIRRLPRHRDLC